MAAGVTKIADVIVPTLFSPYVLQQTKEKTAILASGAAEDSPQITNFLNGEGLTTNIRSFKDLDSDAENVSSDDETTFSSPKKIGTLQEIQVRLSRNQSWSSMDLVDSLNAVDPMDAIAQRVSTYWARRLQAAFVATVKGVFADNDAAPSGTDTHTQYDMRRDISGASYVAGVTSFSAEAFVDACLTMGDAMEDITLVVMHSVVYARAQKNNLIDFIPDSQGQINIPTFLGRRVVVDDGMPVSGGVYETWLFKRGAFKMGLGSPKVPTEVERKPSAGNGGGQEILYSRIEACMHPVGYQYKGTSPVGGPSNAASTNNLADAGSWSRVFPERKMIGIARLITRES